MRNTRETGTEKTPVTPFIYLSCIYPEKARNNNSFSIFLKLRRINDGLKNRIK